MKIVGNKFIGVSNGNSVKTVDQFLASLKLQNIDPALLSDGISIEQGVSHTQAIRIKEAIDNVGLFKAPILTSYFDQYQRCNGVLTHKLKAENTLISDPGKIDEDIFHSILMIDDECAELSDHVTGKHLQFMVLIEAGRQMANAVTQKFYSNDSKIYMAENMNISFESFAYPFAVDINFLMLDKKIRASGDGKLTSQIQFFQSGKRVAEIVISFTVMDKKFVSTLESMALKGIDARLAA
ncbi:AfsA-related hotdog domain-containing protein [Undibacterium sp. Dicai25W]|uniref:AfsA-related hotdog domain-containing protein n=1 Tax=Undibacterium sp. Dicai25W TaxID=3413034 RepID=UPI003BF0AC48